MLKNKVPLKHPGSYKDPSGFIFSYRQQIYRQINHSYQAHYDRLMKSGLYQQLNSAGKLVSHQEVDPDISPQAATCYKIIKPDQIDYINYPYEWSFSMLKDAALLTLEIQQLALEKNMILKDASAYNIVFNHGQPIFIDSLSFENYVEETPWIAYRQFCQHFLAPLTLAAYQDLRFIPILRNFLDGFPLDFAAGLLPKKTLFNLNILLHIHGHAKSQSRWADNRIKVSGKVKMSRQALWRLVDSLQLTVKNIKLSKQQTQWVDYYQQTSYSGTAFSEKQKIVKTYLLKIKKRLAARNTSLLDLGANNGEFSRLGLPNFKNIIAVDIDPMAVEFNYLASRENKETNLLPLVIDLTNPSPNLGLNLTERQSFLDRFKNCDAAMALALIHHLSITYNLPFENSAELLAKFGKFLIIEFIPKDDSQVQILLKNRVDIFSDYNIGSFERVFGSKFKVLAKNLIPQSKRHLYLLEKK